MQDLLSLLECKLGLASQIYPSNQSNLLRVASHAQQ